MNSPTKNHLRRRLTSIFEAERNTDSFIRRWARKRGLKIGDKPNECFRGNRAYVDKLVKCPGGYIANVVLCENCSRCDRVWSQITIGSKTDYSSVLCAHQDIDIRYLKLLPRKNAPMNILVPIVDIYNKLSITVLPTILKIPWIVNKNQVKDMDLRCFNATMQNSSMIFTADQYNLRQEYLPIPVYPNPRRITHE